MLEFENDFVDRTVEEADLMSYLEEEEQTLLNSPLPSLLHSQPMSDSFYQHTPEEPKEVDIVDLEYKQKTVLLWRESNGQPRKKKLKWTTEQHAFNRLPNEKALYRWAKLADSGQKTTVKDF
ncbi:hypothetical protein BV898_08995 [Hypsibius exemplaris]|uniref:Uncharacterized protein n=1 Tax=Hypsibius exemplaris TaxID=2072580 RepID=A0A1W0WNS4_HYPEX|nr:hypothetical protein BV898_08995 [Hypsibius exemplaris]